jgi:hypothetical protein
MRSLCAAILLFAPPFLLGSGLAVLVNENESFGNDDLALKYICHKSPAFLPVKLPDGLFREARR